MSRKDNNDTSSLELCDLLVIITIVNVSIQLLLFNYDSCQQIIEDIDSSIRRLDYNYEKKNKRKS